MTSSYKRAITAVAAVALLVCTAVSPSQAAEEKPLYGAAVPLSIGIGGARGEVTSEQAFRGFHPATVAIPSDRLTVPVTAYFTNQARHFGPDGYSNHIDTPLTYSWRVRCGTKAAVSVTPERTVIVPAVRQHVTGPNSGPSLAESTVITLPGTDCWRISLSTRTPLLAGGSTTSVAINLYDPGSTPQFRPVHDAKGDVILYTVTDAGAVEEITRTGSWTNRADTGVRYFFTNCAAARDLMLTLLDSGRPRALALLKVPTPADAVGKVSGMAVKRTGKSPLQAWGVEQGVGWSVHQATVVTTGANPYAGC